MRLLPEKNLRTRMKKPVSDISFLMIKFSPTITTEAVQPVIFLRKHSQMAWRDQCLLKMQNWQEMLLPSITRVFNTASFGICEKMTWRAKGSDVISNKEEMHGDLNVILAKINQDKKYKEAFQKSIRLRKQKSGNFRMYWQAIFVPGHI